MIRIIVSVLVYMFLGWLLCDINPDTHYTWYSGIWHGLFFVCNLLRSIFSDALYKATDYTATYNFWWWITTVWTCIGFVLGNLGNAGK